MAAISQRAEHAAAALTPAALLQLRVNLLGMLRDFSRRTAKERGVTAPQARNQLALINALAKHLLEISSNSRAKRKLAQSATGRAFQTIDSRKQDSTTSSAGKAARSSGGSFQARVPAAVLQKTTGLFRVLATEISSTTGGYPGNGRVIDLCGAEQTAPAPNVRVELRN